MKRERQKNKITERQETKITDKKKYMEPAAGILALALLPVAAFYLLEFYTHNPFAEVRYWAQFFNILLFELIAWILFFLTGRVRTAIRTGLVLAMVFGLANAYVVRFRTNPIVPWDIFSWKTAASVASNYDFVPDVRMVLVSVLFLALLAAVQPVRFQISRTAVWKRMLPGAACVLVLVLFAGRLQDENFQTSHKLYPFLFTPVYMTNVNGIAVTFVMDLAYISVEKPEGYRAETAQALLDSYETDDSGDEKGEGEGQQGENGSGSSQTMENAAELPNLIVIMNESFSDLSVLGEFTTNVEYVPYLHSLMEGAPNTVTGTLNVSVCGGNTANTEFEFLTGHSMAFLPQGSIPYQQYINGEIPALPEYLASLGYETIAMHPYYADGWERDTVYPELGFSDSIFIDEYDRNNLVRKYVSDDACVDKIIQIYEEKEEGTPLFIFNVTMQNHGGYTDAYDNFTPDVTVEGVSNFSLNQYLSLVKLSDASLEKLISYFEAEEEKTVVVFFGDHQPNDTVASGILNLNGKSVKTMSGEEQKLRYQVPYVIWANFDIPGQTEADTSVNYLAAEVLTAAGLPTTAYQNYLLELKESYPVISAVRVLKADGTDTNAAEEKEGLREYQRLQYYQLFDWDN